MSNYFESGYVLNIKFLTVQSYLGLELEKFKNVGIENFLSVN